MSGGITEVTKSSNEARQIVMDGLERRKEARALRDAELERQERMLRMTINDNHLVKTITEEQKKIQAKEAEQKRRESWAKRRAEQAARDMAAEEAVHVYGIVVLAIILVAAIFRLNFFVALAMMLGMGAVFGAYLYRIYVPFKGGKQ